MCPQNVHTSDNKYVHFLPIQVVHFIPIQPAHRSSYVHTPLSGVCVLLSYIRRVMTLRFVIKPRWGYSYNKKNSYNFNTRSYSCICSYGSRN